MAYDSVARSGQDAKIAPSSSKSSISVVIPMYNSSKSILAAINSVTSQSAISRISEIILVDDGSQDNTVNLVENYIRRSKFKSRFKLLKQKNSGPSSARNAGIRLATGEYIAFLDSDDTWSKSKIKRQCDVLDKFPHIAFLGSSSNLVRVKGKKHGEKNLYRINVRQFLCSSRIATPSVITKSTTIKDLGCFDENMKYCEDQNLFMKIAHTHRLYALDEPLVNLADKPVFGGNGLSGHLTNMHKGVLFNLKKAKDMNYVNHIDYVILTAWEYAKYLRRILITRGLQ